MRITPLDVRKQEFKRVVRGADPDEVQAFLATVADEYEAVLTDNKQLREKVIELDEKVGEYRNMEKTLRDTLLTAERVMTEARQNARKEAELILRDAQLKASQATANIEQRVDALRAQLRELRGQRDSFLARLQSLAEAQVGLVESYRKDFASDDERSERLMRDPDAEDGVATKGVEVSHPADDAPATEAPSTAPRDVAAPSAPPAAPIPMDTPPVTPAADPADQWKGYRIGGETAPAPPMPPAEAAPAPNPQPASAAPAPDTPTTEIPAPDTTTASTPDEPTPSQTETGTPAAPAEPRPTPPPWASDAWTPAPEHPASGPGPRDEDEPRAEAGSPEGGDERDDEVNGTVDQVLAIHDLAQREGPAADDLFEAGPQDTTGAPATAGPSGQSSAPVPPYPGPEPTDPARMQAEAAGTDGVPESSQEATPPGEAADAEEGESRWSLSRFTRGLSGL